MQISLAGVQPVYSGVPDNEVAEFKTIPTGSGSIHTIQCTGLTGQTGVIDGSLDGVNWVNLVTFNIENDSDILTVILQFLYLNIRVTGDANVIIVRGAA